MKQTFLLCVNAKGAPPHANLVEGKTYTLCHVYCDHGISVEEAPLPFDAKQMPNFTLKCNMCGKEVSSTTVTHCIVERFRFVEINDPDMKGNEIETVQGSDLRGKVPSTCA